MALQDLMLSAPAEFPAILHKSWRAAPKSDGPGDSPDPSAVCENILLGPWPESEGSAAGSVAQRHRPNLPLQL